MNNREFILIREIINEYEKFQKCSSLLNKIKNIFKKVDKERIFNKTFEVKKNRFLLKYELYELSLSNEKRCIEILELLLNKSHGLKKEELLNFIKREKRIVFL